MAQRPPGRPRGRPKKLDRDTVIDAAMHAYWRGVEHPSLNEVARRVGVSKPALYREFGGEDGLLTAVLERYRAEVIVPTLATLSSERPFAEVLRDLLAWMTEPRDAPPGCLFTKMRLSTWRLEAAASSGVDELRDEMRDAYAAWYRRALARGGEVDPDLPAERAAVFIDTQLTTVLIQLGLGEDPEEVRAEAERAFRGLLAR
jgi:AcrR family transcriptional regulator